MEAKTYEHLTTSVSTTALLTAQHFGILFYWEIILP